jgi:hypothetical protein
MGRHVQRGAIGRDETPGENAEAEPPKGEIVNYQIDDARILKNLLDAKYEGIFEAYRKTIYEVARRRRDGQTQMIQINILDAGPEALPQHRFHCHAVAEDGAVTVTGLVQDPYTAIGIIKWASLDPVEKPAPSKESDEVIEGLEKIAASQQQSGSKKRAVKKRGRSKKE